MIKHNEDTRCDVKITTPYFKVSEVGLIVDQGKNLVEKIMKDYPGDEKLQKMIIECCRDFGFMSSTSEGYDVCISTYRPYVKTKEKQTCPRRILGFGPWEKEENLDTWDLCGDDKVCSFCGSLHPDRLLELIKKHGFSIVEPSTKAYKWYVNQPDVPNASYGGIKYYRHHDTPEFIESYNQLIKI